MLVDQTLKEVEKEVEKMKEICRITLKKLITLLIIFPEINTIVTVILSKA